jgi:hypothetical protein
MLGRCESLYPRVDDFLFARIRKSAIKARPRKDQASDHSLGAIYGRMMIHPVQGRRASEDPALEGAK